MRNFNLSSLKDEQKDAAALRIFGRKTLLKFWSNFIGLIKLTFLSRDEVRSACSTRFPPLTLVWSTFLPANGLLFRTSYKEL